MTGETAARRADKLLLPPLRQFHQREPVARRIDLRGGLGIGSDDRLQIELRARLGVHRRRIDQPVTADEHPVACSRQIGQEIAAAIVGDDDPREFRRQVGGLRHHPHASLGSLRARDHSADIVGIDGDAATGALRVEPGQRQRHGAGHHRGRRQQSHLGCIESLNAHGSHTIGLPGDVTFVCQAQTGSFTSRSLHLELTSAAAPDVAHYAIGSNTFGRILLTGRLRRPARFGAAGAVALRFFSHR